MNFLRFTMVIHFIQLKTLIMKKFILILITSIVISFSVSAQTAGDYRSIGSGNWNDATKWEIFNGSSWITASTYPGQNSGTGAVTIMIFHEISLTATVPHPIVSLLIDQLNDYPAEEVVVSQNGILAFSSENTVSLTVSGSVAIHGELTIDDQNGSKAHTLSVGGGFEVGTKIYDECFGYEFIPATFQTINQDDKLSIMFTGYSWIDSGPNGITFQDVTFDGTGFVVITPVYIKGGATFINGIVSIYYATSPHNADCQIYYSYKGSIFFYDGAIVSGASNASFVDGTVGKGGNDPFTFPIGRENIYAPLTISAPASQDALVGANYGRSNLSDFGPINDPGLFNVSNCEYWELSIGQLINGLDVTVGWSAASGCASIPYITNVSEVTLAHFSYSSWSWDSHGGSGIGSTTSGSVTWNGVTASGWLTLGNLSSTCNAPWGSATNISSNSATISWPAVNGAVSYDVDYKPYTSSEWINAASATTSTSLDLTSLRPWMYYDWRIRTNCSASSSSYMQRQFQTLCGPPSGLTTTNVTHNSATLSWSALSNWVSYNVEYKQATSVTWIPAATGITSLSYILQGLTAGVAYDWRVLVNCTVSIQGGYSQSSFTTLQAPPPPPPLCNDVYESNNSSSQAKTISLGITIPAIISSALDVDWFKVTTPNNSNANLQVVLSNLPADYDLYVYNKSLKLVGSSATSGTSNEVVVYNSSARKATYYIKVVGKNGAYNTSQCYNLLAQVTSTAGSAYGKSSPENEVTDISDKQLLYPNPASEFVYLNFNSATEGLVNIQIVNSIGQLVKQHPVNTIKGHNQIKIQVADIRPGMYILRINKGDLNLIRKFVIAR